MGEIEIIIIDNKGNSVREGCHGLGGVRIILLMEIKNIEAGIVKVVK